jgi:hypothetical protein
VLHQTLKVRTEKRALNAQRKRASPRTAAAQPAKMQKLPEVSASEVLRGFGGRYCSGTHGGVDGCCERPLGGYTACTTGYSVVLSGYSKSTTQWVLNGQLVGTQCVLSRVLSGYTAGTTLWVLRGHSEGTQWVHSVGTQWVHSVGTQWVLSGVLNEYPQARLAQAPAPLSECSSRLLLHGVADEYPSSTHGCRMHMEYPLSTHPVLTAAACVWSTR